ncbi:hypothetical protein JK231_21735 [Pantoea sp. JGM49]|uniref:hypothetical protein n=1 Tax=Pantoea sp. JGM49 TaxID=2799791 RepID=UPI001BAB1DCF|nr:hypothetical protein [Pantoea sp. JGM49]MBS0883217.1 hypothetical protein [Pantoea sp. JGM49]
MLQKLLRKEGLAVAAGTMLLYTSVYFFERGYCTRLNIPLDYIEISIPTIANDVMYCLIFIFPVAAITLTIMITGERKQFKGFHALSPFYCWLAYAAVLFYFMEHTWGNAGLSLFLGGLYFYQITPPEKSDEPESKMSRHYATLIRYSIAVVLVSTTFVIYGNSFAADASFDTYTLNGKQYALLKVYGENVFMQEIKDGKRAREITYFNAQNMTGMTLSGK